MHVDGCAGKHLRISCIRQRQNIWPLGSRDIASADEDCSSLQPLCRGCADLIKIPWIMHCRGTLCKNNGRIASVQEGVQSLELGGFARLFIKVNKARLYRLRGPVGLWLGKATREEGQHKIRRKLIAEYRVAVWPQPLGAPKFTHWV